MRKQVIVAIGVVVAVGLVVLTFAYIRNSQEASQQNEQAAKMTPETDIPEGAQSSPSGPSEGRYTNYSEPAIDSTSGRKVLFFHAPWCPQCRMIENDIEKSAIPSGVTIFKVDYDSNQSLRQEYGVTLQTTFVEIGNDRKLINKYVAYNEPTFDSVKTNLLNK